PRPPHPCCGPRCAGPRALRLSPPTATTATYSLSLHDALPIYYETIRIRIAFHPQEERFEVANPAIRRDADWIQDVADVFAPDARDRKSTRLNSSHVKISYAVFCLKKKKNVIRGLRSTTSQVCQ